eukprot:7791490-Ditylum_brightwellii.AAC.1
MGLKAKDTEEHEWKLLTVMTHSANTKHAANNNNNNKNKTKTNNVKHNIDGVKVTMITSSVNNGEEEEVSEKEDYFFMPDAPLLLDQLSHDLTLFANTAMLVRDGDELATNTNSHVVPTGNVAPQHSAGSQKKSFQ